MLSIKSFRHKGIERFFTTTGSSQAFKNMLTSSAASYLLWTIRGWLKI